jgi:uncharacterized protein
MDRQEIIAKLRECEAELRARGVRHAALFGSVARGTATAASDIDIMLDLDVDAVGDVYDYVELKQYVASLFSGPVDVISRSGLKPSIRSPAEADAVYAF